MMAPLGPGRGQVLRLYPVRIFKLTGGTGQVKINKNPEYFLTIAAEQSISKAAEKLYVSQPYLSQHVSRLEDFFQVRLLDRKKSPITLTPAGQIYVNYLQSCTQLYQKLLLDFDALNANRRLTLRLGFSNWRASTLLPDILPVFSEKYPEVKLEFFEVPTSELYRLIAEDKVDFVIMNTTLNSPDYVTTETIMQEKILLVGNRNNPTTVKLLEAQEKHLGLDLRLLENERMILLRPEIVMASRVNNYLDKKRIVLRNFVYTTNTTTAINLAAQNYGFCFMNETGTSCVANFQDLVFFDLDSPDMIQPLCVVYKKTSYLLPIAKDFIDITIDFYKTHRLSQSCS